MRKDFLFVLCAIVVVALVYRLLAPYRHQGELTECKSRLKNLGTPFEMYSTDWQGKYPTRFEPLYPKYLTLPVACPATGRPYKLETGPESIYNTAGFEDYYHLECHGLNHAGAGVPAGFPRYDGISSIHER